MNIYLATSGSVFCTHLTVFFISDEYDNKKNGLKIRRTRLVCNNGMVKYIHFISIRLYMHHFNFLLSNINIGITCIHFSFCNKTKLL